MAGPSRGQRALAHVVRDEALAAYDFGPGHPMVPVRLLLTWDLVEESGLFSAPGVVIGDAPVATRAQLTTVHTGEYVDAVQDASGPAGAAGIEPGEKGLHTADVPVFERMHEASARIVGGTLGAVDAVLDGTARHGVNVAGGMHHAMPGRAAGFCVYNDAAIGIRRALERGARRIVYLDLDVHHGDGVEHIFWDDPRVTTISLHESGTTLFPGTGFVQDVGGPSASGEAVNIALPAGTGGTAWLRALRTLVPPIVDAVRPDLVVSQHGCDCHAEDPLGRLDIPLEAQRAGMMLAHDLAQEHAEGRWVALGGGGYAVQTVVPRAWTHLVAIAAHGPIDPASPLPPGYRRRWTERIARHNAASAWRLTPVPFPETFGDGPFSDPAPWEDGFDPGDPVDRAIMAVRRTVFPLHGLDAWFG